MHWDVKIAGPTFSFTSNIPLGFEVQQLIGDACGI